jgi:hypothetical protein
MVQINKNIIYQKFTNIIKEYLKMVEKTEFIKNVGNSKYIVNIGLNTIIHVFKIILIKTTNIDLAYYYSQKSYYCYLEYIEQMNNTSMMHNLNNTDAVIFVYNKTINNIDNFNMGNSVVILNNKKTIVLDVNEIEDVLENILQITKIILYWENPLFNCKEFSYIANDFILKFILMTNADIIPVYKYIEVILDKMIDAPMNTSVMTYEKYDDFLNKMYKRMRGIVKTAVYPSISQINERTILLFYINKDDTLTFFNTKSVDQFIGYLFQFDSHL